MHIFFHFEAQNISTYLKLFKMSEKYGHKTPLCVATNGPGSGSINSSSSSNNNSLVVVVYTWL